MYLRDVRKALAIAYAEKISVELEGGYGIGKTTAIRDAVKDITKMYNEPVGFKEILGPTIAAEEARGIPMPVRETWEMRYTKPPFFPSASEYEDGEIPRRGIIFIDETRLMSDELKAALTQLQLEGRLGQYSLADYGHWVVFSATNRDIDMAGGSDDPPIVTNRKLKIQVEPLLDDLLKWMSIKRNKVPIGIRVFTERNPGVVLANKIPDDGGPFMTPRSLVRCGHMLQRLSKMEPNWEAPHPFALIDTEFAREMACGMIGDVGAGALFSSLRLLNQVPTYDEIINRPSTATIPDEDRVDALAHTAMVIGHQAGSYCQPSRRVPPDVEKMDKEADALTTYMQRLSGEWLVSGLRHAINRFPALQAHPSIQTIASKYPAIFIAIQ